jgi:hypothetical protein
MYILLVFSACLTSGLEKSKSGAKHLDNGAMRRFALIGAMEGRNESC